MRKLDETINMCLNGDHPWMFDALGRLITEDTALESFGELEWIQLFVC